MRTTLSAVFALALAACDDDPSCTLKDQAERFASNDYVDCGFVPLGTSAGPAFDCAATAFTAGESFVVRVDSQGKDSHVAYAWVGTIDGEVFRLAYDGDPSGGGGDTNPDIARWSCDAPSLHTLSAEEATQLGILGFRIEEGDTQFACQDARELDDDLCR